MKHKLREPAVLGALRPAQRRSSDRRCGAQACSGMRAQHDAAAGATLDRDVARQPEAFPNGAAVVSGIAGLGRASPVAASARTPSRRIGAIALPPTSPCR
ncbi:MAG: hypothetical protein JSR84_13885 [Proteobacteria bacterium]|nr:hypothetical protein [Pseudomonadota bacterium]